MERDYYSLLGVSRFASQDAIRRAFHSRILLVHPDHNPTDKVAADRAREVIAAYKALADPDARQNYDQTMVRPAAAVVAYRTSESGLASWITKAILAMLFLAMSIGLVLGVSSVLANRGPVFRPYLGAIDVSASDPAPLAVVAAPDVSNCKEWYAAQEYEITLASSTATANLIRVYSEAARSAFQGGNSDCGMFYTRCIKEIQDSGPSVVL